MGVLHNNSHLMTKERDSIAWLVSVLDDESFPMLLSISALARALNTDALAPQSRSQRAALQ